MRWSYLPMHPNPHTFDDRRRATRRNAKWYVVFGLLLAGCPAENSAPDSANGAATPWATVTIRLLVVDDPQLAGAIRQRAGDWQAQTGSILEVDEQPATDLLSGEHLAADAVIYPAWLRGPLAEKEAIRPVSPALLADAKLNWPDVFPAVRLNEAMWGQRVQGLPLGSPVLMCYYREDLLEQVGRSPPTTWREYQELAERLSQPDNLPEEFRNTDATFFATAEPLAPGWAGLTLLARAAAYVKHPNHYSTWFDIRTMEPRIDTPPVVRALEELAAAARLAPQESREATPADVRAWFHEGRCALALSWPSNAAVESTATESTRVPWALAELPGATEMFDPDSDAWSDVLSEGVRRVALLGIAGRLASVTSGSSHPDAAEALLAWLIGTDWGWGAEIGATSHETTMFRGVHVADPRPWIEPSADDSMVAAESIQRALGRPHAIDALPLAGRGQYLEALDRAVYQVLDGLSTPADALAEAAERWRAITETLGADQQRRAYRRGLGLLE